MSKNPHPNVMRLDFTVEYGPDVKEELMAVFNIKKISTEEVKAHIEETGHDVYHPHILVCYPEQWRSVFSDEEDKDEV